MYIYSAKKHQKPPTMAKVRHKEYNLNDFLLFPPCIGKFVPENHPVRTVNVAQRNSAFTSHFLL